MLKGKMLEEANNWKQVRETSSFLGEDLQGEVSKVREKVSQLQTNFNFFVGMLLQEGRLHLPADDRVVESKGVKKFEFFANLASQSHH